MGASAHRNVLKRQPLVAHPARRHGGVDQCQSADAAKIHEENQDQSGRQPEIRCDSQCQAYGSDGGGGFEHAGEKRKRFEQANEHGADREQGEVEREYGRRYFDRLIADPAKEGRSFISVTEGAAGIQDKDSNRRSLHAARRGAGGAADQHQNNTEELSGVAKSGKICRIETSRSRCDGLEQGGEHPFLEGKILKFD